jgi:hypothetical protein
MLKATLALLLVLAALTGGLYAFNGSRSSKRSRSEDASSLLRRYQRYFSPSSPPAPLSESLSSRLGARPHIAMVVVAAIALVTSAYFGLGPTLSASAGPTNNAGLPTFNMPALHNDVKPDTWHSDTEEARLIAADATPAPTPVPETPAPTAVPTPVVAAATQEQPAQAAAPVVVPEYAPGSIEGIICALPWPCAEAIGVARCESGTDRNGNLDGNWATNGNHFGLFQISGIHAWRWADFWDAWMDPVRNAQYAFDIWSESGWRPWSCRPY